MKEVQVSLLKTITWTKKGKQEWEKACIEIGKPHWKLNFFVKTKFSNKVIMFEKMLEFKQAILLC
jgi:hypothetical protein